METSKAHTTHIFWVTHLLPTNPMDLLFTSLLAPPEITNHGVNFITQLIGQEETTYDVVLPKPQIELVLLS